ncbi:MAG: ATP-dependent RNA helicase HrpA [Akkermansia sp.]|nr:ATP-dependent RNA helicase HrpA [Akkermansia sp.]
MQTEQPHFSYPDLPISRRRREIADALRKNRVVVVVGETGSGKTTQLPKIALEVAGNRRGMLGCTQPRRLAAVAVARRIAEEVGCNIGEYVGYQVRFDDKTGKDTKLKLMTDGILLAETQDDRDLRKYHTIILDEAHERSLNIDFLLGYLKLLMERRQDLKLIISSATMDAGTFSEFFDNAPVINVEGRTYHVDYHYMPQRHPDEELPQHVARAVQWLSEYDERGDVLVFLPGEREIRDCADELHTLNLPRTDILPLFARLGLAEQQRIFHPSGKTRRIVLATNVAETSLTIPGIIYVIDSGLARVSRYLPGRQIQRLQVESISQASARQRAGRCGRVTEGVCIRLYSQKDFEERDAYTDPEIKRSALAGVILRMADLRLPPLGEFPLPDPPSPRLVNEGYKTLREIGALDRNKKLTPTGRSLARLPLDPRLGRMLLEAEHQHCLPEMLVIVAGLSIMDPRERPQEFATQADQAHAQWKNADSDFISMLTLWRESLNFKNKRTLNRNQLRKWCSKNYLSFLRMVEWHNLEQDLSAALQDTMRWSIPSLPAEAEQATPEMIHRSILAGAPLQFGFWRTEEKIYRGAGGRDFAIFPGSGMFRRQKRAEWIFGTELVETSRLFMRRCAILNPEWVEQVAPQLCAHHAYDAAWDKDAGQVFAKERVTCGGLTIIDGRRISYARINMAAARGIMIQDGIMACRLKDCPPFLKHLQDMKEEVRTVEAKLRRRDLLWCREAVFNFFSHRLPKDCTSEKALRSWREKEEKNDPQCLFIPYEECIYPGEDDAPADLYPDELHVAGGEYPVYYSHAPGEADDGITLGVHIDQLAEFPDWLPSWGVQAHLADRAEILLRTLPKDVRNFLMPIGEAADDFAEDWFDKEPDRPLGQALAEFVMRRTQKFCNAQQFDFSRLPAELITKIWVCDDKGDELAFGTDAQALRDKLAEYQQKRFRKQASRTFSATPMTRWDCGELPATVDVGTELGYPALQDDGERVRIKVFPTQAEADRAHRFGVRRLALIKHGDFINGIHKRLPLKSMEAKLALTTLGTAPKNNAADTIYAAMDAALCAPLPRNAEQFDAACTRMRERLYDTISGTLNKLWEQLAEADRALREYCLTAAKDRYATRIAEDLQRDWQWLTRPFFLSDAPPDTLQDISRFARGIIMRLQKISQQPAIRELERIDTLNAAIKSDFYEQYPRHATSPAWLAYGLMVAEYRLSLFAPTLAVKGRASVKKLEAAAELLVNNA